MLEGHEFDLQALMTLFPEDDPRVLKDDEGRYYLESSELDSHFDDHARLLEVAEVVLGRLVGVARLAEGSFQPVTIVGRFDRPKPAGGTDVSIHLTDSAVVRDRVTVVRATAEVRLGAVVAAAVVGPGGDVVKSVPRGQRYLDLAKAHPEVKELLDLLSTSDMSWEDLYKAYEIVREASKRGGRPRWSLDQLGYAKREVDDFTMSVNLHRHARPTGLPQRELTLAECQQFVRELAERWFQKLGADRTEG